MARYHAVVLRPLDSNSGEAEDQIDKDSSVTPQYDHDSKDISSDLITFHDESDHSIHLSNELIDEIIDALPRLADESAEGSEYMHDEKADEGFADGSSIIPVKDRQIYDSQEIPDLSYFENIEYPENIQFFHDDMPRIADKLDDVDFIVDPYVKPIRREKTNSFHNNVPKNAYQMFGIDLSLVDPIWDIVEPPMSMSSAESINHYIRSEPEAMALKPSRTSKRARKRRLVKSDPKVQLIIKDIEEALCAKLKAATGIKVFQVPWSVLTQQDLINWPRKMPVVRLYLQDMKNLELLHSILSEIDFTQDFIKKVPVSLRTRQRKSSLKSIH